jgi:hypothetical protein
MCEPAEAPGQFAIIHCPKQSDFARGPTAWTGGQPYSPALAFCDDFFDRPSEPTGKDRISHFAEPIDFGARPFSAPAIIGLPV